MKMSTARHMLALLKSHVHGNDQEFLSVAMQVAAHEARLGHGKIAQQIRDLIDQARARAKSIIRPGPFLVAEVKGELASLLSVDCPETRLSDMTLAPALLVRLNRVITEHRQQHRLREHHLQPRRKLLLVGPPGTGKTLTAAALAGELHLPLLTILLEGLITKYLGDTATKLRVIFDAMTTTPGVYFFDEFDAIGAKRTSTHDVGEIRRVLNSFLQFVENDKSLGIIIAATNHPELLDRALFRRFDDVLEYHLPDATTALAIIQRRLASFQIDDFNWEEITAELEGLSQADFARAADDAAKQAILNHTDRIQTTNLIAALHERRTGTTPQ